MFIRHGICRTHTDISTKGDNGGMVKHTEIMRHGHDWWKWLSDISYNKYYIPAATCELVSKPGYSLWSIRGVWVVLRFKQQININEHRSTTISLLECDTIFSVAGHKHGCQISLKFQIQTLYDNNVERNHNYYGTVRYILSISYHYIRSIIMMVF